MVAPKQNAIIPPSEADAHFLDWPNAGGFNALDERRDKVSLPIQGTIPAWAAGTLYRIGPGGHKVNRLKEKDGEFACDHWFDGWGTIHKFELTRGADGNCDQVSYQSRRQCDEQVELARKTGNLGSISFGQKRDPCDSIFRKVKTVFTSSLATDPQVANVAVTFRDTMPKEKSTTTKDSVSRQVLNIATDNHLTKQVDAETLEPIGIAEQTVLHPQLAGPISAAHAAKDPTTGELFNFNLQMGPMPTYRVFCANPTTGKTEILAKFATNKDIKPAYIHSLMLTPNFVILCIWSAHFVGTGIQILWERNFMDAMSPFDPQSEVTWLVIDRHHGRGIVKRFKSPAFFAFHTTNAWEEPVAPGSDSVNITCELYQYQNSDILHKLYYRNLLSNSSHAHAAATKFNITGSLTRYQLPQVALTQPRSQAESQQIYHPANPILSIPSTHTGDLQQINPASLFRPHRYVWATTMHGKSSFIDGLVKTDTHTQTAEFWSCDRHTPGEPIFVGRPGAQDEDDGVLLSVVYNGDTGLSYLLCLDAKSMGEVGRAEVPVAVGFGFHGMHVPLGR